MSSTDSESSSTAGPPGAIPSELRLKTVLCRYFIKTTGCTQGQACRYAHGPGELRPVLRPCDPRLCKGRDTCKFAHEDVAAAAEVHGLPAVAAASAGGRPSGVTQPSGRRDGKHKRGRQTVRSSDSEGGAKVKASKQGEAPTGKSPPPHKIKLCDFYNTERGCLKGEQCTFAHGEEELQQSLEAVNTQRQLEADQAAAEAVNTQRQLEADQAAAEELQQKLEAEDEQCQLEADQAAAEELPQKLEAENKQCQLEADQAAAEELQQKLEAEDKQCQLEADQAAAEVNDYAKKWSWLSQEWGEEVEVKVWNTFLTIGPLEHKARSHERSRSAGPLCRF